MMSETTVQPPAQPPASPPTLTWGQAVSEFPQGRNGFYAVRFDANGKQVGHLPFLAQWALSMILSMAGFPTMTVVVFLRLVRIFTPEGFWISADAPATDEGGALNGVHWIGPVADRINEAPEIAAALGLTTGA